MEWFSSKDPINFKIKTNMFNSNNEERKFRFNERMNHYKKERNLYLSSKGISNRPNDPIISSETAESKPKSIPRSFFQRPLFFGKSKKLENEWNSRKNGGKRSKRTRRTGKRTRRIGRH